MKTVVRKHDVARLWAKGEQEHARTPSGNFYFQGDTIYSYGAHFPIARHMWYRGQHMVLLTWHRSSVTTAGHISLVHRRLLIDCLKFVIVTDLFPDQQKRVGYHGTLLKPRGHRTNVDYFRREIKTAASRVLRARSQRYRAIRELLHLMDQARDYASFFWLRTQFAHGLNMEEQLYLAHHYFEILEKKQADREDRRRLREESRQRRAEELFLLNQQEREELILQRRQRIVLRVNFDEGRRRAHRRRHLHRA